jgi:lysophospholipase L1-like esterase
MPDDIRICFIGDSFVNGTGDPEYLGWVGRLCSLSQTNEIELTHYNLGVRGDTSENIKQRWESECNRRLAAHADNRLVFSFGVNDTTIENGQLRVSTQNSIQNTNDILVKAAEKYNVIMIGPPPVDNQAQNERIKNLDAAFQSLSDKLKLPYLPVFNALLNTPAWLKEVSANDGAHPKSAGYRALAQLVKAWDHWAL